jgi:hypothetical protein
MATIRESSLDTGNVLLPICIIPQTFHCIRDIIRFELNIGESLDEHVRPHGIVLVHNGRMSLQVR